MTEKTRAKSEQFFEQYDKLSAARTQSTASLVIVENVDQ